MDGKLLENKWFTLDQQRKYTVLSTKSTFKTKHESKVMLAISRVNAYQPLANPRWV